MAHALNDPVLRHWTPVTPSSYTEDDALAAIGSPYERAAREPDPTFVAWAVADGSDDRLLGKIQLADITDGTASVSYWTHPDARGRGVAGEALGLVVAHAFADRRLFELRARVAEDNAASLSVLVRRGFTVAGPGDDHVLGDGSQVRGVIYRRRSASVTAT